MYFITCGGKINCHHAQHAQHILRRTPISCTMISYPSFSPYPCRVNEGLEFPRRYGNTPDLLPTIDIHCYYYSYTCTADRRKFTTASRYLCEKVFLGDLGVKDGPLWWSTLARVVCVFTWVLAKRKKERGKQKAGAMSRPHKEALRSTDYYFCLYKKLWEYRVLPNITAGNVQG